MAWDEFMAAQRVARADAIRVANDKENNVRGF